MDGTKKSTLPDSQYITHPLLKEKMVEGRPYQALILNNIINCNSLVVAPTGTGKTIIFLLSAIYVLQNFSGFVIILAPTLALVDQHVAFFREKTKLSYNEILAVTGKITPENRKNLWGGSARVFVSTPRTVSNDLTKGYLDLSQCSLLVIDEAHRGAQAKCKTIMKFVRDARNAGSMIRILAASATIPEKTLFKLMRLFDLEHIEIKTSKDPEIQPYVIKSQTDQLIVPLPEQWHQVMGALRTLRAAALRGVTRHTELTGVKVNESASTNTLLTALKNLQELPDDKTTRKLRGNLISRVATAIKLDHAIDSFSRQGKTAFLEFVEKLYKSPIKANQRITQSPELQKALEIVTALKIEHPKVRELLRILEQESDKSTMVFSQSKQTVFKLTEIFKKHGISAAALVGKRDLSEKERTRVLRNFKSGNIKVLVSSSAGEEGLDIGCDFVIFYDATASAVRRVQRKGRLRKHGHVLFLIAKDTADDAFHWISTRAEKQMAEAFEQLKTHSDLVSPQSPQEAVEEKPIGSDGKMQLPPKKRVKGSLPKAKEFLKMDPQEASSFATLRINGLTPKIKALGGPSFLIRNVAVFRLNASTMLQELAGGTLLPKLIAATKAYKQSIIILEEGFSQEILNATQIHVKTVFKTLSSIVFDLGISVIPSNSIKQTKLLLEMFVGHQQGLKEHSDLNSTQEELIASLPGVSSLLAKRLLAHHKTPQAIFLLSQEELQQTPGIGEIKGQKIHELLNRSYIPENHSTT